MWKACSEKSSNGLNSRLALIETTRSASGKSTKKDIAPLAVRLGGAAEREDRIRGQRSLPGQVRDAESLGPDQLTAPSHGDRETGDLPLPQEGPQILLGGCPTAPPPPW